MPEAKWTDYAEKELDKLKDDARKEMRARNVKNATLTVKLDIRGARPKRIHRVTKIGLYGGHMETQWTRHDPEHYRDYKLSV